MRTLLSILLLTTAFVSFAQDKDREAEALLIQKKANNFVHQGNEMVSEDNFIAAEKEYRKAISEQPTNIAGTYNLGNSYYKKGNYDEALFRQQQAAKNATEKSDKHKAFHNIGNILMKNKQCKEAVEAYKNALRNDPTDEETRYNLALAKDCAAQQQDQNKDQDKDKQDENKDEQDKKDQENKDQDNKGDQDKKEGDDQKDKGQPKEDQQNKDKGDEKKEQQQQPQPGQLSPQQIKNLLEAMNNQEQKTQEKINAEKQKGVKVRTDKDW
ncbi:tetratricopeptide repeat protein [Subsaxibacter sp. CAU 1640]|uniref:tetratricopeptide repeat protein n=1 Tax=Subsaxibacter sp. CAU 1640 TaxID=2933271 RepID=UPI002005B44C|nr:tetratricopeptide repeat protein [Subsaxibacter sp. CAU 1640]MCK7589331.1 tetratricopeptide repeat protein [Subsaxibacter sp. CAU 1640]